MANFLETPEGQAWAARYAAEHNGNMPGENPGETIDQAIANLMWSQDFAGATGQAPTQQDWEEAWWARQSDDSWFKPYLDLANEALRPDFFTDSPAGQSGGNANTYPGGGAGVSTVPPSGSVTVTNPVTGQSQDWFGRERYEQGGMAPPLAPVAGAPAGSGMFSSDYYKQLTGPLPRGVVGDTPVSAPTSPMNQTFAPMVGRAPLSAPAPQFGPQLPVPQGVQFGPPLPPSGASPYLSPAQAGAQNVQAFGQTVFNPATYTLQGAIPRTQDYLGRGSARNASALQYTSNALAQNIQGGANNIENFWRYLNQR